MGPAAVGTSPPMTATAPRDLRRRTIGRNIRYLRMQRGLRQDAFARLLGVTWKRVSDWEVGRHEPNAEHMETIARFCGVTVGWLTDEHEETR
jgi:DNA-binding transcriptional regulator YiaG